MSENPLKKKDTNLIFGGDPKFSDLWDGTMYWDRIGMRTGAHTNSASHDDPGGALPAIASYLGHHRRPYQRLPSPSTACARNSSVALFSAC